jgi:hypothetical protein
MTGGGSSNTGTNMNRVKQLKFDGSAFWAVFHQQFEAMDNHNDWTSHKKAMHLLATLQGQAADILQSILAGAAYKDIIGALEGHYREHQLVAAYWSQLRARIQFNSKSLQKFAAALEQMAHWALVGLPVGFIQRKATHAFVDGLKD